MIVHISIPSTRPREIAQFLSKIIDGVAAPFPSIPGAWIAMPLDGSGNAVEVFPLGTVSRPGEFEVQLHHDPGQTMASAHHVALTTKLTKEEVLRLAKEMDFRGLACERGGAFGVIEVWIENQFLVEVVTEPELKRYLAVANPEAAKRRYGAAS